VECSACTERFADRLDGSLSADEARRMEAHLDACPACRLRWAQYQGLVDELRTPDPVAVRAGFADHVVARVSARPWAARGHGLGALVAVHGRLAAAAVVVLVGLAAGVHFSHRPLPDAPERPLAVAERPDTRSGSPDDVVAGSAAASRPSSTSAPSDSSAGDSALGPATVTEAGARPTPVVPSPRSAFVGEERAPAEDAQPHAAPSRGGAAPPASGAPSPRAPKPETGDSSDAAADRRRAAMNLIGGTEGMSTSFSTESLEGARARQMIRENPYSNAAPERWTDPSRTHHNFVFRGTRLATALDSVAKTGNIRIVTRGPMNGNVSVNIQNARPEAALERIASLANLRVSQRGSTYVVEQEPSEASDADVAATHPAEVRPPE